MQRIFRLPSLTIQKETYLIPIKNGYNPEISPVMDYQVLSNDELVRECVERPCPEAWGEFIRRFHPVIAGMVIRACRNCGCSSPDVFEDLTQDTFTKLFADNCATLRRYQPRHENSFLGYLKVVTVNLVYDHFRKKHPVDDKTDELNPAIIPGRGSNSDDDLFFQKIDKILRERGNGPQEKKERAIFWLYYHHGMTAKEIASIPAMNLTIKGVESCIFRLIVYIKKMLGLGRDGGIHPEEPF